MADQGGRAHQPASRQGGLREATLGVRAGPGSPGWYVHPSLPPSLAQPLFPPSIRSFSLSSILKAVHRHGQERACLSHRKIIDFAPLTSLPLSLPPSLPPALAAGRRELQSRMTVAQDWMSDETLGAYIGEPPAGGGTQASLPPSLPPSLPSPYPPFLCFLIPSHHPSFLCSHPQAAVPTATRRCSG